MKPEEEFLKADCCSEEFKPSEFLQEHILPHLDKYVGYTLAQRVISSPHADHFRDIECLQDTGVQTMAKIAKVLRVSVEELLK